MKISAAADRSHPPIWLFGILPIAGAVYSFTVVAMPFLLRREGIPVGTIGGISALALLPLPFQFAWAPIADMLLSRRNWILVGNLLGAMLLFVAVLLPRPKYLTLFVVLLFAGNIALSLSFTAIGGLMAVLLPDRVRSKAAGWFQAGNIGSISFLGGAALWLIERTSLVHAAAGIALMSFLPSLSVLLIKEPRRSLAPDRAVFGVMFGEVAALLKKRETWLGLLFFLSPVGAGAAYNLFTAIGVDYHASPGTVLWVTGLPGGVIVSIAGALFGGAITDFFPRRVAYVFFGTLIALAAVVMAVAPLQPVTFSIGGLAYQFTTSMACAAGTALGLELCGADPMTAGTRMAIFTGAINAPLSYMPWLDGLGYQTWGVRGLLGTDACITLAAAALLVVMARKLWRSDSRAVEILISGEAVALGPLNE
ncbi:MAG: MFS transporter [Opitutaceae bacterium]|jgi:MFS family permease